MQQQRMLLLGGVGLVKGKVHDAGPVMVEVCDKLEPILNNIRFTEHAPFKTISLILRFGRKINLFPEFGSVNKRNQELPLAVELDMEELKQSDRQNLSSLFMTATLEALIHAGRRYGLPVSELEMQQIGSSGDNGLGEK